MQTPQSDSGLWSRMQWRLFAEEVPYGMALLRITLPIVLLIEVLPRWRFTEELFSTNGVNVSLMENFGSYNYLQPLPPFWAACLMSILVLTLVTMMVGWFTRLSVWVTFALHTYFVCNDMASTMTKFSVIETHTLLLLALSGCGQIWSVDSWIASRRDPQRPPLSERPAWAMAPLWPQFLMLFMLGCSYIGAAITKLHMPDFITGDAITYWIMSNPNFRHAIGEWMTQHPGLLIASSHFTVLWEIIFIFLCWRGIPRVMMFVLGYFFHIMAALMLGEVTFLMVITTLYLGCARESEYLAVQRFARGLGARVFGSLPGWSWTERLAPVGQTLARVSPRWQGAVLTALLLTVGLGGAWANQKLDLYGIHRADGPYELQPMDQDEAARLFAPALPIREIDKYLGIRVGSMLLGGRLSNHCSDFRYQDLMICEAALNPPHEDMWIECHILGEDGKIVHRDGVVAPREAKWAQFSYRLEEKLEPGTYTVVIRSRSQEICRQDITLEGSASAPVAN